MTLAILLLSHLLMADAGLHSLEAARNRQDRAALEKSIERFAADARTRQDSAEAQYRLALANSYLAEIAMEMRDKTKAREAAEEDEEVEVYGDLVGAETESLVGAFKSEFFEESVVCPAQGRGLNPPQRLLMYVWHAPPV